MSENIIILLVLLSPAAFIATAVASWFQSGLRPVLVKKMSLLSVVLSIAVAGLSSYFVVQYGLIESSLIGFQDIGLSIRLDALSILMLGMISLLGFIIIKFSQNYLP